MQRVCYLDKVGILSVTKNDDTVDVRLNFYSLPIAWCVCVPFRQPPLTLLVLKKEETDHFQRLKWIGSDDHARRLRIIFWKK